MENRNHPPRCIGWPALLSRPSRWPFLRWPSCWRRPAGDDPVFAAIAEQRRCKALSDDALVDCVRICEEAKAWDESGIEQAEDAFSEKNKAYFDAEMAVLATQPDDLRRSIDAACLHRRAP